MEKIERIALLKEAYKNQVDTIMSYPERGPWGDKNWWGNWSGFIPGYFMQKFNAKAVCEIYAGSGTTSDVAKDLGIRYTGIDLSPTPTRSDIISMNILDEDMELPDGFYEADIHFSHPPYPGINNVKYSDYMWNDTEKKGIFDIQNMSYEKGMTCINKGIMRDFATMKRGAYLVIMVGEIRSKGQYHSMIQDICKPGIFHQSFVKIQHNTRSGRNTYGSRDFALTGQEMIAVFKKPSGFEIAYVLPKNYVMDIRDSKTATWKDVVWSCIQNLGTATLSSIYAALENCKKALANANWKAKVRQVLQKLRDAGLVVNNDRGVWAVA